MKKIVLLCFALVLLASMAFVACEKKASTASEGDKVTITFWDFPNFGLDGTFEAELIKAFEAKNPDIKVSFELISFTDGPAKIETAIAAKNQPDMVMDAPGRIIAWGNAGVLAPLDDIVSKQSVNIASILINTAKGSDGKVYMYPINNAPFTMAFNKEMLEDFGVLDLLPYKTEDRTWTLTQYEALLKAVQPKLPRGAVNGVVFAKSQGGDQGTRAFMINLYGNAPLMNSAMTEYVFNTPNAIKNLTWLQTAVKSKLLENGSALSSDDAIDMFVSGNAAHTILYSSGLAKTRGATKSYKGKPFTEIFMPYPNETDKPQLEFLNSGMCIFNNNNAQKVEAAKKFVEFMATDSEWAPKIVEATSTFASNKNINVSLPWVQPEDAKWLASASKFYGQYYNALPSFPAMRPFWFPTLQGAMNGQDPKTLLDTFVKQANGN